ncbi:hypothetical protein F8M41_015156 [Gigaspora margarita]|uniref:F-box domain-containing protein n=1 Tax=Gigaspora margarita TaxID=4874 RepID=A0A8H4AQR3_GIGMA|nr:hypothetical protein F8M41_015156 [Gigaspora margarita]
MLFNLPLECLVKIFGSLDYKTLFTCLCVNREWRELVVLILWSNPDLTHAKTIRTLLLKLNEDESAIIGPKNILPKDDPNLCFDYPNFVSTVSSYDLDNGINNWLKSIDKKRNNSSSILISMILMFLRTGSKLTNLVLDGITYYRSHKCDLKNLLSDALCQNNTLISLKLFSNEIGNAFSEALLQNNTLTYLDISDNQISDEAIINELKSAFDTKTVMDLIV